MMMAPIPRHPHHCHSHCHYAHLMLIIVMAIIIIMVSSRARGHPGRKALCPDYEFANIRETVHIMPHHY